MPEAHLEFFQHFQVERLTDWVDGMVQYQMPDEEDPLRTGDRPPDVRANFHQWNESWNN
jgi:hypothetical protein